MYVKILRFFVACLVFYVVSVFVKPSVSNAEPWLSTRYAQNCAGCHAPGRINLKPKDRRCSLSCQGCHVNPNGGGLRSFYGKWNEDRVLRSWVSESQMHKRPFAPNKDQKYGKKPFPKLSKKTKRSKKFRSFIKNKGMKLVTTDKVDVIDKEHDRFANPYERTARNRIEFLYQVPDDDPYREKFKSKFDGGADLRWQFVSGEVVATSAEGEKGDPTKLESTFFMSGDFGLRYRPIYEKYHLVYESRMRGTPSEEADVKLTLKSADTRSLYFMADDLPYNVFVMYGFYRPLIGNYTPDHTLLSQKMLAVALGEGSGYNIGPYETLSIGTAPNVPYANIHLITGSMNPDSAPEGFVLNTGLRFVSYGASVNYTYWNTVNDETTSEIHSVHLGGMFGPAVINYEGLSYFKEDETELKQGGVHFLDLNIKAYKEIYGVVQYLSSNVSESLTPGSASQMKVGVRGFLYAGVDLQLLYETKENSQEEGSTINSSAITSQLHIYM
jgi:hypothetical protein